MKKLKLGLSALLLFVIFEPIYAQDWANLSRYQKENSELRIPPPHEQRVVFMGNSITEGWLKARPEFFADKKFINRGISGQTTPQMLLRFRQDVINLMPSVVVILAGTNDIAENTGPTTIEAILGNIVSMVELSKANKIEVILCSILPAYDFPWRKGMEPTEKISRLNSMLKNYAIQHNIFYVDYFTPMANESNGLKKELGNDGVHPNISGYLIMEALIEKTLSKVLNTR